MFEAHRNPNPKLGNWRLFLWYGSPDKIEAFSKLDDMNNSINRAPIDKTHIDHQIHAISQQIFKTSVMYC